jgi:hypothetical protein
LAKITLLLVWRGAAYALARSNGILSGPAQLRQTGAEYFRTNIYVTRSGYFSQPPLKCAVEVVGIDRMLVSVDYLFSANARGRTFLQDTARWVNEAEMKKADGRGRGEHPAPVTG